MKVFLVVKQEEHSCRLVLNFLQEESGPIARMDILDLTAKVQDDVGQSSSDRKWAVKLTSHPVLELAFDGEDDKLKFAAQMTTMLRISRMMEEKRMRSSGNK